MLALLTLLSHPFPPQLLVAEAMNFYQTNTTTAHGKTDADVHISGCWHETRCCHGTHSTLPELGLSVGLACTFMLEVVLYLLCCSAL